MSKDWAAEAAKRLREETASKKTDQDYRMMSAGKVNSHAPYLWEDLKRVINQKANELNGQFPTPVLKVSTLIEHRQDLEIESPRGYLRLEFDQTVPIVRHTLRRFSGDPFADSPKTSGDLVFAYIGDEVWFIKKGETGTNKSAEDAAEYLLNMVL